jgi:hypothetical protein
MDEYSVYRMYLALRLHFTTDDYDVVTQKGRVRASRQAFAKRKDLYSIKKIAKTYSDEEVANFLVANFVSGDRWGGMFDMDAGQRYKEWKKRVESLSYNFQQELDNLIEDAEGSKLSIDEIFEVSKGQHPYIIKAFLRNTISVETLVILERLNNFTDRFDREISDTIVWPDISRLIKKYKPFLLIDLEKYNAIFRRRVGIESAED